MSRSLEVPSAKTHGISVHAFWTRFRLNFLVYLKISSLLNKFLESTIKGHNLTCRYNLALRSFEASFYMHHFIMHPDMPVASEDESTKKVLFSALRSQHCHDASEVKQNP